MLEINFVTKKMFSAKNNRSYHLIRNKMFTRRFNGMNEDHVRSGKL